MAMMMDMDVVIVGGGLAGLAVGLHERGIRCHVYEKAPKVRPHSGTALSLTRRFGSPMWSFSFCVGGVCVGVDRKESPLMACRVERIRRGEGRTGSENDKRRCTYNAHEGDGAGGRRAGEVGDHSMSAGADPWKTAQQTLSKEVPDQSTLHYRHTKLTHYKLFPLNIPSVIKVKAENSSPILIEEADTNMPSQRPHMRNAERRGFSKPYFDDLVVQKLVQGGVEARFEAAIDGDGGQSSVETKVVRAKLLVGADGLRSQVRKILVGAEGDEHRDL